MPPLYHRVWQYLKYMVNHKKRKIPMKDGTFLEILPGQHLTSIRDIAKNVGWYEGVKWKQPNPKTIKSILDWLEKQLMITVDTGNRQYTLITLLNWEIYQSNDDEGNSEVLEENKESAVKGNGSETEKTLIHQSLKGEVSVSSNSKVTAREQCADINNNDQECLKNDLNAVVEEGVQNLNVGFEGMPITQDAVPTFEKGADSTQKKISKSDYEKKIADKYLTLRQSFSLSPNDELALKEIVSEKIPLSTVLEGLDKAFEEYRPKHSRDKIKSLNYCVPIIYDLHYVKSTNLQEKPAKNHKNSKGVKQDKLPEWIENQHYITHQSADGISDEEKRKRAEELMKLLEKQEVAP